MIRPKPFDFERLELISVRLEHIPAAKKNQIIRDMEWLRDQLRAAWVELEKVRND